MRKYKPDAIIQLEKKIGKELKQISVEDIALFDSPSYSLDETQHIVELKLNSCGISDISYLEDMPLKNLINLNLDHNQIADISSLSCLLRLENLTLSNNRITDIGSLSNLSTLKKLNLNYNQITNIDSLFDLLNLKELYLGLNKLTNIESLSGLVSLISLDLRNNQLTDISSLSGLVILKILNLDKNQLTDLSAISSTRELRRLYIGNNQIIDISPLSGLLYLVDLSLYSNKIIDISSLSGLVNLENLYLRDNKITDISALPNLKKLQILDLRNNSIIHFPKEFLNMKIEISWEFDNSYEVISLQGNPLETPPIEVVKQGKDAIRYYFKEIEKSSDCLIETKLLIVGNGEVGKTTLMRKLIDNDFQIEVVKEPTTEGIDIHPWQLECPFPDCGNEKVNVHIWDFGGQEIYHATHQFFLTKRSLYLFIWEARKEEETQTFDYWLNIIKLLSEESPVIIVMNKSDIRVKHLDEANFKTKFSNIVAFRQVSCKNGEGIQELTTQIRSTLGTMPHLKDKLPKVWKQVRDRLKEDSRDYISLEEYFQICKQYDLNREGALYLSRYLHDLGVILHYDYSDLEFIVILNLEWATEALYTLIDTRDIQLNKGRFQYSKLKEYWDLNKFPPDKHRVLMLLMEKFQLCFNVVNTDTYIVPEVLPPERPGIDFEKYETINNLRFQYRYEFMPEGIISRFISLMYYLIQDEHFWKNGVELRFESATALVISEPLDKKITISVNGRDKVELLAIIRNEFAKIHATLNLEKDKQHYKEMIACTCSQCAQSSQPFLFNHSTIKRRHEKGKEVDCCEISDEDVSIEGLLKGVERESLNRAEIFDLLLYASLKLQGIRMSIKPQEDNRNDFIKVLLESKGLYVQDQTRLGISASGETIGKLDFKITNPDTNEICIAEAFRLDSLNKSVIDLHLEKIFFYDANGYPRNFILVYAEARDFISLWKKYLEYVPIIPLTYPVKEFKEQKVTYSNIKIARALHLCNERTTEIYHIFIQMEKPKIAS